MKQIIFMLSIVFVLTSCKGENEKNEDIVNEFLTIINSMDYNSDLLTDEFITKNYKELFKKNYFFPSTNWKLNLKSKNDSVFVYESKSQGMDDFGIVYNIIQVIYLKHEDGKYKIYDSSNLVTSRLDFEILGIDFENLSDMKKYTIFENVKKNLLTQTIVKGNKRTKKYVEGEIRITNNSQYDIKELNLINEHFNKKGVPVNTDQITIHEIIRKNSYRDKEWLTSDCEDCYKQKITINFIKED